MVKLLGVGVLGLLAAGCGGNVAEAPSDGVKQQQAAAPGSEPAPAAQPAPQSTGVLTAAITIDGVTCGTGADQNPWLQPANGGRWILNLDGPACDLLVQISGDAEKGYPQIGADAWEGQPHIKLFKRVPNSQYLNEQLLSHESKTDVIVESGGKHVVAYGTVTAWQGFEQPKTHEVKVDFTLP